MTAIAPLSFERFYHDTSFSTAFFHFLNIDDRPLILESSFPHFCGGKDPQRIFGGKNANTVGGPKW